MKQTHCKFPGLLALTTPPHASLMVTEPEIEKNFIDISFGFGVHISTFRLSMVFCCGLHLFQREVSLMRKKTALTCGYENKCLDCISDCATAVNSGCVKHD